jgi:sec-independent protein translocase protein TatC
MVQTKRTAAGEGEETQVRMSFGEHLDELRKRIIRSLVGSIAGVMICLYYINDIVIIILHPYRIALLSHGYPDLFSFTKPAEIVINYLTLAVQCGLILCSPWIIYQIWQFVAAGLYKRERRIIYWYIGPSAFLFLLGVAFFYFVVLPLTLNFFVGFTMNTAGPPPQPSWIEEMLLKQSRATAPDLTGIPRGDATTMPGIPVVSSDPPAPPKGTGYLFYNAAERKLKWLTADESLTVMVARGGSLFTNTPRLDDYLHFVTMMTLIMGLSFQMPMVIVILAQVGIVHPNALRKARKYAYFGILVLSVILAPSPDLVVPLFFFIPLVVLYEVGILAAHLLVGPEKGPT